MKLKSILLFITLIIDCNTNYDQENDEKKDAIKKPDITETTVYKNLDQLIQNGKAKVFKESDFEVVSILGPRQETYDCWIHAPFNAWRLLQGDSPEDFAGTEWDTKLREEIIKIKRKLNLKGTEKSGPNICINNAEILSTLKDNQDFIDLPDYQLYDHPKDITKNQYNYFTSGKGNTEFTRLQIFHENCGQIILEQYPDEENMSKIINMCNQLLRDKAAGIFNPNIKLNEAAEFFFKPRAITTTDVDNLINYHLYWVIIEGFQKHIKRLREGHPQVILFSFTAGIEYPSDHVITMRIESTDNKILIINSEARHIGLTESIKKLYSIFYNTPLPEELK